MYSANNRPGHIETDKNLYEVEFPIKTFRFGKPTQEVQGIPWKDYQHIGMLKKNRKPFFVASGGKWVTEVTKKNKGHVFIRVSELSPGKEIAIYDYNGPGDEFYCEGTVEKIELEAARVVMHLKEITPKECRVRCAQILEKKF